MPAARQPWLYSPATDLIFLIAPAFVVTAVVLALPQTFSGAKTPAWAWLALVVGIDVAHVYSTLYRTYFDRAARAQYRTALILIPLACWACGVLLYSLGSLVFWRLLAYLAVYHFVRQQYGFFRLYARKEPHSAWSRRIDAAAIYLATLYPLVYWHTHPRKFQWFIAGDFASLSLPWLSALTGALYLAILVLYVAKEVRARVLNLPKQLILAGTALSWYTGIVVCNGDLAFTVTNVVAHGVPYIALIWMYQRKRSVSNWFVPSRIPLYLAVLFLLAYFEEAFWDALVWRDHTQFFTWLQNLPHLEDATLLAVVVPLLTVPQASHYVLDGLLWRVRDTRVVIQ